MSTIKITCDNCGAGYKLPASFKSPKAKCQKCGSVIDVAAQRDAADDSPSGAAAAASPAAAARPAVDRSKSKPAPARAGKGAASQSAGKATGARAGGRRRRGADGDGDDAAGEGAGEGRRGRTPKKKDNTPMIFGGIGLVALIIVLVVFLMQEDEKPDQAEDAQTNQESTGNGGDADKPDQKPAAGDTTNDGDKPADGDEPISVDDGNKAIGDNPDAKPAEASAPQQELPPDAPQWMKIKIQTMDQVNTTFAEVPWDLLSADKKAEVQELAANYAAGGRPGIDAEKAMRERPYEAMFGLLDILRGLDHTDAFEMSSAYPLNRFMTEITHGLQTGFQAVTMDEQIDPRKAEWNCRSTRAWLTFFKTHPDTATFEELNEERRKKELKDGK